MSTLSHLFPFCSSCSLPHLPHYAGCTVSCSRHLPPTGTLRANMLSLCLPARHNMLSFLSSQTLHILKTGRGMEYKDKRKMLLKRAVFSYENFQAVSLLDEVGGMIFFSSMLVIPMVIVSSLQEG